MEITRVGAAAVHETKDVIPSGCVGSTMWEVCGEVLRYTTQSLPDPSDPRNNHKYTISIPISHILDHMIRISKTADPDAVAAIMAEMSTRTVPRYSKYDHGHDEVDAFLDEFSGHLPPADFQKVFAWWLAIASGYRVS